jgi:hypothetical protein
MMGYLPNLAGDDSSRFCELAAMHSLISMHGGVVERL